MTQPAPTDRPSTVSERSRGDAALNVKAQTERLRHAFGRTKGASTLLTRAKGALLDTLKGPSTFKAAKIAVGVALIAICGIGPARRMFQDASIDAIVNAKLITVRAPIEGIIDDKAPGVSLGTRARASQLLFTIRNPRADRGRLDDLAREIAAARARRDGLKARLQALRTLHADLLAQIDAFTRTKRVQLRANVEDLKAQIAAAEATRTQAENDLARAKSLAQSGAQAQTVLDRSQRDATIASEAFASLTQRLVSAQADLHALDAGYFVGDSYNDRPSSKQQADDVTIRIAETAAELGAAEISQRSLNDNYVIARSLQEARSTAAVSAPGAGRIWDVLVTPGEEVARGQPLLRILDCSSGLVTGTVRKAVYDKLGIGQAAQFDANALDKTYVGVIVRLSASSNPENLAISSAGEGPYTVTVAIPELASSNCGVGQSGRLVFLHDAKGATVDPIRTSDLRGTQD